jgi:polysaccharide export outer membrane protein
MNRTRLLQILSLAVLALSSTVSAYGEDAQNERQREPQRLSVATPPSVPTAEGPRVSASPEPSTADYKRAGLKQGDYRLGPGDAIRIVVFQNPDLTLDTRVAEGGTITYPLIGSVDVGGFTIAQAERNIAAALKKGGFVQQPQVNIILSQVRGNQVSVLGQVNHPGRFPLETFHTRISDLLAMAGGISAGGGLTGGPGGADKVVVIGLREGQPFRKEIDLSDLFAGSKPEDDFEVASGDVIYVPSAPVFYIYGEAQRAGSYRVKRGMSVQQAMAEAGGPTVRGTERGIRLDRRDASGKIQSIQPSLDEPIQANDVIYVRESLF